MVQKIKRNFNRVFKGKEQLNLTSGSLVKPLFYLSLPVVISNLLMTAYNLADTFWLGRLSKEALAGITFAFPPVFLFISFAMGIAVAGSVLVAQYEGAGRRGEAEFAAAQTLSFGIVVSLIIGISGFFLIEPLLDLMGASPAVLPLAASYMRVILLGIFFLFGFAIFMALMRGYGDTVTPMILMGAAVVLNVILDPILIFGWGIFPALGIQGAAIATLVCRGLALMVGLWILFTGRRGLKVRVRDLKPDFSFYKKMLVIGVPASVEGSGRAVSVNALLAVVGRFSTTVVAGYGLGIRVFSMVFLPALAVSRSVETMTGQNVGAGRFDRAESANQLAAGTMFAFMTILGVFCFFFPAQIVSIFTTDQAVVAQGAVFIKYIALTFGFVGAARSISGGFRGSGKTMTAAVIAILMLGVIRVPLAWYLSQFQGPKGIWTAFVISNVIGFFIAWGWFKRGTWKEAAIDKDSAPEAETAGEATDYEEAMSE